ncbi:MAG: nucleoside recognition domain-containing protein [Lachnospiraceae bacterium]
MLKRRFIVNVLLLLSLLFLLSFPSLGIEGASFGLLSWYQKVLPTLFPAMILTSIMIKTNAFSLVMPLFAPLCSKLFGLSSQGSCALITGWLCGYPMGAKTANELLNDNLISQEEASYLLYFSNQASPMFLAGFLRYQILGGYLPLWKIFFSIYGSAFIISIAARLLWSPNHQTTSYNTINHTKKEEPALLSIMEQSFTSSSSIMITIGIYMMLFSIATRLIQNFFSLPPLVTCLLSGILEMTSGITQLADLALPIQWTAFFSISLTAFGGLCTAMQVRSASRQISYFFSRYLLCKFAQALLADGILYWMI